MPQLKMFTKITIVLLILLTSNNIFINQENNVYASCIGEDETPPTIGDWVIDSIGNIVTNETIILNGNLIIKMGGYLIFKNVTLLMNCTTNGTYYIKVESGGKFYIFDYDKNPSTKCDNSIITSAISDGRHRFHFYVKKNSNFEMKNSELHECGYYLYDPPNPYWTRGLCIEANNTLIENSIFSNNLIGILFSHYSSFSRILNSKITYNLEDGLSIGGNELYDLMIENCTIASNGRFSTGNKGVIINNIDGLLINDCNIYNNPRGIYIISTNNTQITKSNIINNNYGLYEMGDNLNLVIENNTFVGNIEYSIYSHYDKPLKVQYNYFGTTNEKQINTSIYGNHVDYSNWLDFRESIISYVNTTENWENDVKYLNNGLIINGNLTIENTNVILNNTLGKNFILINGKLILKNSTVRLNRSNTEIISIWGGYSIIYSFNSSGRFFNVKVQEQKGICINSNNFQIENVSINGNFSVYKSLYGFLIQGHNNTISHCNISNVVNGVLINSKNNKIKNSKLFSNSFALKIIGDLNAINNNQIEHNGMGIEIDGRNYVNISRSTGNMNKIFNNNISENNVNGISIVVGDSNYISNSKISKNDRGIMIYSGVNNTIINCNITNNEFEGIKLLTIPMPGYNMPSSNKIFHNNILNNGINNSSINNVFDNGNNNIWDNGYPNGGNFWSDYKGDDLYSGENQDIIGSDGLGDIPYEIKGELYIISRDNYPLLYPVGEKYYILSPYLDQPNSPDPDGNYTISWTSVLNATNYTIYEEHEGFTNKTELGPITILEIKGKPNGTYQYYVQAKNDKVVSRKSNTIKVVVDYPPDIPRGLNAIPLPEGNTLELKWLINNVDTINYSLWSNYTGLWKELDNITHPLNKFIHTGLSDGQKYYYKIKAWDGINQSSKFSKIVHGIPEDIIPPASPIGLKASTISNSSIELSWEQNNESDMAGYDLYWTTNLELNFSKINIEPIINSSYLDTGLTGNTTYYYKLKAYDEVPNYSEFSNIAFNTTYITSPRIISYTPKGYNVPLDSEIIINFSKSMNRKSVEKGFEVKPAINGEFIWNDQYKMLSLKPTNGLKKNTTYNVTLANPIFDLEGGILPRTFSWEFITIELPKIIKYSPQGVFVNTDIIITIYFNRDMNKTSVEEAFSIEPEINGTFKWITDKKLVFEPENRLPELTTFEITIDYLAQDMIGNIIDEDFSWSFRTGDFTAPEILSYSPTGVDIAVDTQISIVFSEPMNKSLVETSFIISPDIDGEVQWQGNTLLFLPENDLKYNTKYTITLSSDTTDKWGNPLLDDLSWEFTTEEKKSDDDHSTGYDMVIISGIIVIVIILIVVISFVILRKRRESSTGDVIQQQDETLEE